MDGWLDDLPDEWVEAIDADGNTVGWTLRAEAQRLDLTPQLIETPDRYLKDPWVRYHAQLIEERGLYRNGQDLNDVQTVLVGAQIIKRHEFEAKQRDQVFEENMLINNPEMYQAYMEKKKQTEEVEGGDGVEQRIPRSIEEFLANIAAFSEGDSPDSDKEGDKAEGWLASFLDSDDLDEMSE